MLVLKKEAIRNDFVYAPFENNWVRIASVSNVNKVQTTRFPKSDLPDILKVSWHLDKQLFFLFKK